MYVTSSELFNLRCRQVVADLVPWFAGDSGGVSGMKSSLEESQSWEDSAYFAILSKNEILL